ncbi:AAA family ATPase [Tessaracoccus antarcticus]|uniref:ATP-binding protein n=1 Tax=Tessaracoccus antarcticus TaxID=2479848 RepID=A0A3M0G3S8_9ACTN|nr:AAA family ATPase [Tessaracoccus antarcticus]RMB59621.1 ATP-binding protein [Tessaracoccus antarcticus]
MYTTLAIHGYRSLRDVVVRLGRVTVVLGPNGAGKSNLYKALRLLAACGQGDVAGSLAREGGLDSVLWAGPESLAAARRGHAVQGTLRRGPISLKLGVGGDSLSYLVDLGLPVPGETLFNRDPEIKREAVWVGPIMRPATLLARRKRSQVDVRDDGPWQTLEDRLPTHASLLSGAALRELRVLRDELASWRFYDALRVDAGSPARQPRVGTRTWALDHDGSDLAAALQTIIERGREPLAEAVADAFDGAQLGVVNSDGLFDVALQQPGMLRPLRSAELSDGTLRHLMWLAAFLAPNRPPLMAVNEPENSLHPGLLGPLGRLIARASTDTQLVVVTHSLALVEHLRVALAEHGRSDDLEVIELAKNLGETIVRDQGLLSRPPWEWGSR